MFKNKKLISLINVEEIELEAQDQIKKTLEHDFVIKLAIMPDVHCGYDLPIGAVALMDNVISSSAVGYDIGCGMVFVNTQKRLFDILGCDHNNKDELRSIMQEIIETIPMGFGKFHKVPKELELDSLKSDFIDKPVLASVNATARNQIGTLGGGNHFIEIGLNESDCICVTLHSGSRNPGHQLATYFNKIQIDDLLKGYFYLDSDEGQAYLEATKWAEAFALENRLGMAKKILSIIGLDKKQVEVAIKFLMINENHNHAVVNEDATVIHRKGATPADKGQYGVIPINIRDGVYVTRGRGNKKYLSSASHGAGRRMSRKKAKKNLDLDKFLELRDNIVTNITESSLDEAPEAYKDGDMVIGYQDGIVVDIVDKTRPLIVVKGD